jgi:hypothetical protein
MVYALLMRAARRVLVLWVTMVLNASTITACRRLVTTARALVCLVATRASAVWVTMVRRVRVIIVSRRLARTAVRVLR